MGKGRAGLARYVVDAVVLEGRSAREVARAHGISKSWIYEMIARYRDGGYQALEPRSRRPRYCKHGTPPEAIEAIVSLREQLHDQGHDCGAATISYHLADRIESVPSRTTIWRILRREGLIVPAPQKRPRSSLIRFEADLPNEMWQTDITHWHLADGEHVEIMNMIDDHSRLFLASEAYLTVKARDVVDTFHKAASLHGLPASLLSDNGARCSPRHHARARCSCKQNSSDTGSPTRTPAPTTPKPAERSSAYTKHSSATSTARSRQRRSQRCNHSSTRSSTTTTTSAPTEHSTDAPPYRPTTHRSTPDQPPKRSHRPTSASVKTRSTKADE